MLGVQAGGITLATELGFLLGMGSERLPRHRAPYRACQSAGGCGELGVGAWGLR